MWPAYCGALKAVGAESHRVTGWRRVAEVRGVARAESQASYRQAGWAGRRHDTDGAARFTRADTTCDERVDAWLAQAGVAQAGVAQAGVA